VLAVISLVDLTRQLVEWAALIHAIAERYAQVRRWLFKWVPFHIPEEWHDYIVLGIISITVMNAGYYRRTGRFLFWELRKSFKEDYVPLIRAMRDPENKMQLNIFDKWLVDATDILAKIIMLFLMTIMLCFLSFVIPMLVMEIYIR